MAVFIQDYAVLNLDRTTIDAKVCYESLSLMVYDLPRVRPGELMCIGGHDFISLNKKSDMRTMSSMLIFEIHL